MALLPTIASNHQRSPWDSHSHNAPSGNNARIGSAHNSSAASQRDQTAQQTFHEEGDPSFDFRMLAPATKASA